ncbi:MAG TPA: sigma 54-interacting transcriptional regulator, partial [Thermodesulfobacteriota bacterium]|nr:sigma 54-interacting transcriptional regulator [Thermodesulfobacteriota bacterium]
MFSQRAVDNAQRKNVKPRLLVVDDDLSARQALETLLKREGYQVRCAPAGGAALILAAEEPPDLMLLATRLPDMSGFEVCGRLHDTGGAGRVPVVFISSLDDAAEKIKAFAAGGVDYVAKPFLREELLARVKTHLALASLRRRVEAQDARLRDETAKSRQVEEALGKARDELEDKVKRQTADLERTGAELRAKLREIADLKQRLEQENIYLRREVGLLVSHDDIIGQSEPIRRVQGQIEMVARTDSTVLITGETGTGKDLIARAIHKLSHRRDRLMVTINCASLPPTLIESELFGREKGAYTGALTRQVGRFEMADGATLFLDEIGDLPLELQAKLLKVLQDGEFQRVG